MQIIRKIPLLLIIGRLVVSFLFIFWAVFDTEIQIWLFLLLIYLGLVSDIFDGIIARKLNVSSVFLRKADTVVDAVFYAGIISCVFQINSEAFTSNRYLIFVILSLELIMYSVSMLRFRKLPSPHAIASKFWALYLIVEFTLISLGLSGVHFTISLVIGSFVHLERALIYIVIKKWENDIPSIYHAVQIRKGRQINRKKIFNG